MPTRKHIKEHSHIPKEAIIPTKEGTSTTKKPLIITPTGQTEKPRINALATEGKKKKPK